MISLYHQEYFGEYSWCSDNVNKLMSGDSEEDFQEESRESTNMNSLINLWRLSGRCSGRVVIFGQ